MGAGSGFALKLIQWFNRGVQFCCAGLILALTSYFLAAMSNHSIDIPTNLRAVEGIAGIGVLYTGFGILLVCCLAGFTITSFLAMLLDVAFVGAFIYVATVYKDGAGSCSGSSVSTVFGTGSADDTVSSSSSGGIALPTYRTACKMETASFAVAIVAIFWFIISALTELGLGRHRKKEQRFGPSPANGYTSGYARPGFFSRFKRNRAAGADADADPNALPMHTEPGELRDSYNTEAESGVGAASYQKYGEAGYSEHGYGAQQQQQQQQQTNGGAYGSQPHRYSGTYGSHPPPPNRYGDGTYNV